MALTSSLRVAIIGTNNDKMYSGGRYHALILAYALARAGMDVSFVTNKKPKFYDDLEPLAPNEVKYHFTGDFKENLPTGDFDYVILVPTGIFHPVFYEAAFDFVTKANARMALINFESGNWFNAVSPVQRDLRLWSYWHRAVADGGLVISSLRLSQGFAQEFYHTLQDEALRFEVCGPPINSPQAVGHFEIEKDGSIVTFVRSSDPHKGGEDLLNMPAKVLKGRTLKVIAGGPIEPEFAEKLQAHFEAAKAKVEFYQAVSDSEKFRLIAQAQAVLFPSRFEGFGYPPVEAAFMGTEAVCYDLDVLKETVGKVAHMAPVGDVAELAKCLDAALKTPERRAELRESVFSLVDIDAVAERISDILLRGFDVVPALPQRLGQSQVGPFNFEDADASVLTVPPMPAMLRRFVKTHSGSYLISAEISSPTEKVTVEVANSDMTLSTVFVRTLGTVGGEPRLEITGKLSRAPEPGEIVSLHLKGADGSVAASADYKLISAFEEAASDVQMTGLWLTDEGSRAQFTVQPDIDSLMASVDGETWHAATIEAGKATISLPDASPYVQGLKVYAFSGLNLRAFLEASSPTAGATLSPEQWQKRIRKELKIAKIDDAYWQNGVLRRPMSGFGGVIVCELEKGQAVPPPGAVVRLASGRLLPIVSAKDKFNRVNIEFSCAIDPISEGFPNSVEIIAQTMEPKNAISHGGLWVDGYWTGAGNIRKRCCLISHQSFSYFADHLEDLAAVDSSGEEKAIEAIVPSEGGAIIWFKEDIEPRRDQLPPVELILSSKSLGLPQRPSRSKRKGKLPEGPIWADGAENDRVFQLLSKTEVTEGEILVFDGKVPCAVQLVDTDSDGCLALLDRKLPEKFKTVRAASVRERLNLNKLQMKHSSNVFSRHIGPAVNLGHSQRMSGMPKPVVPEGDRPRVMFISIVPPFPADQGNRIVTRNFIEHLISQGFDVDLVLVGHLHPERSAELFGDRVRVFQWQFPVWAEEPTAGLRNKIFKDLQEHAPAEMESSIFKELRKQAALFHPYFIVPDPIVLIAKSLYRKHVYHSIVCNYTHMARVASELADIRPLPPVTIVTHDALSRLPLEFEGKPIDTMYRLCEPETERDVLNEIPGAVVLAISESELAYFKDIGVTNPVVLCEYDGLKECQRYAVLPDAFGGQRIIFHASGNPMNQVAIKWFLENCWDRIHTAVPTATLVICGGISKHVPESTPGVEIHGILSREALMERLGECSIAINPTLAGTGLKIKTVEAACAGIPSVCLPLAIEGLETVSDKFCRLATDPETFISACLELLTDQDAWNALRASSVELSHERFSESAIYSEVDNLLGWDVNVDERFSVKRDPYSLDLAVAFEESASSVPEDLRFLWMAAVDQMKYDDFQSANSLIIRLISRIKAPDPDLLLLAAQLSLKVGNHQSATHFAAQVYGCDPTRGDALKIVGEAAQAVGNADVLHDVWVQLALSNPMSHGLLPAATSYGLKHFQDHASSWVPRPIEMKFNEKLFLNSLVSPGKPIGPGWGKMEDWGCWSGSNRTRMLIRTRPTKNVVKLVIGGKFHGPAVSDHQSVRFFVNGAGVANFDALPLNQDMEIEFLIPATEEERSDFVVDMMIADPAPVRDSSGAIIDPRLLGVSLSYFWMEDMG